MIGYLDTSALVPLLVAEPTSEACRRFWDAADDVVTARFAFVEAAAGLAQAERLGRLDSPAHRAALDALDAYWAELDVLDLDVLTRRAAELARGCGLRGDDAVHCVAAERIAAPDLVAASGDRVLLAAWRTVGIATLDPNGRGE